MYIKSIGDRQRPCQTPWFIRTDSVISWELLSNILAVCLLKLLITLLRCSLPVVSWYYWAEKSDVHFRECMGLFYRVRLHFYMLNRKRENSARLGVIATNPLVAWHVLTHLGCDLAFCEEWSFESGSCGIMKRLSCELDLLVTPCRMPWLLLKRNAVNMFLPKPSAVYWAKWPAALYRIDFWRQTVLLVDCSVLWKIVN